MGLESAPGKVEGSSLEDTRATLQPLPGQRPLLQGWIVLTVITLLWGCASAPTFKDAAPTEAQGTSDAMALVAEGRWRIEMGELAEGLKLMRKAQELDPESAELREELGLALAEGGLGDEAVKLLEASGPLGPAGAATLGVLLAQRASTPAELITAVAHLQESVDKLPPTMQAFQARITLAQSLIRLERGAQALEQVRVLLSDRPGDPRLLLMAGQALRLDGKNDEALEYFRRAGETSELRSRATLEEIETLAAAGRFKEAADAMGVFLKESGATMGALTRWATLLARAGDVTRAREVLAEVVAKDGTNREALLLKATLDAGAGDVDSSEQLFRRALAQDPDDPDAAVGLARLLMDLRRLDEARKLLAGVWARLDQSKVEAAEPRRDVARDCAAVELLDRKPAAALEWLKRVDEKELSRRTVALWAEYFRQGQAWEEGLKWLDTVTVEDDPVDRRLLTATLAEFQLATKDTASAENTLAPLLAGDEDDVEAALAALQRRKLFDEVVRHAKAALARLGDSSVVRFDMAAALERSGRWDEAVGEFKKLIAAEPDNSAALNYLGYMYADKGINLSEAREMLTRAVSLEPTSGAFLDSLGWVYFRLGDLDRAEKHLTEAARLEPFDATVHEHLGDLFKLRGDRTKATECYRRALTMEIEETGQKERLDQKLAQLAAEDAH